ncbi:MAG: Asp-tRNA(Asn)/Glu-tRNA(Gln) amidotransferase subunit GatA [Candidatus Dojkabacteria bacterium]|nr:Asp-tRNA(Asn)/Glu-tRNA(Gln) amidotransferase subunit GatA [Candidatus Dojkabacteria bacterium]
MSVLNSLDIVSRDPIEVVVKKIKSGEVKVVDLVKEHIKLAKDINKYINAFISFTEDLALQEAERIDYSIRKKDTQVLSKKLLGIPFTVKDLYLVEKTKTTFASKYMQDFIAPYTATVVKRCMDEGAILIAKCNCDPWGYGASGENSGFGPTKHPLDFTRTPGGSSSGSAASLLAGVGYFSLATDTGGSVRLPASFCGLYGFKPTYGRNSRYGIGAMASSFDTPGFFARYIQDIQLLQSIMEGKDNNDATTFDLSKISYIDKNLSSFKVAIPKEFFTDGINKSVRQAIDRYIEFLKPQVKLIQEVSIPTVEYALAVYYILVPAEISSNQARYDGVRYGPQLFDDYTKNLLTGRSIFFEKEVKRRIIIGTYVLSKGYADQYYHRALLVREKLKKEFQDIFKEFDIVLSPVSPVTAFKLGEKVNDPLQMYLVDVFTVVANLVGIPAISIPVGSDSNGMPIGIQAMADNFNDYLLFKLPTL